MEFEKMVICPVNNGFIVTVIRQVDSKDHKNLLRIIGGRHYEEITNIFHSLHEVANYIGNIAEQQRLRKDT